MKLVDRWIGGLVVRHVALALTALLAVFTVVNLAEELRDADQPGWGVGAALWFVLLGPAGALLYRLVQLSARSPTFTSELPAPQVEALEPLARLLDWPAAQLMTLALAVDADFDAVAAAWRDYHAARGHWFALIRFA